jgi:uncharacterized protein YukE
MPNINGIPSTTSPGVQGEIRNPIEKLGAVIGLKRKDSVWAKRHEAIANDYEFKRQIADAAYASVSSLRAELGEAEGRRGRLNEPQAGRVSADELRTALAEVDADVARAKSAYAGAVARNHKATHDMNDALRHLRRVQVLYKATDNFVSVKPSPLPKGETAQEAIDRIDAEIAKVKAAVRPQEEVVAEAMADIDRQAALAVPRVSFGKRVSVSFPVVGIAAEPSGEELPHAPTPIPFICRYFRSDIEKSVTEQVAERYRNVELQLSEQSKGRKLKELEAERLSADRVRCAEIWAAYDRDPASSSLNFHADCDARAILGIDGPPVKLRDDED